MLTSANAYEGAIHLVLLTASFPFGRGEEFLEDEIPVVAARFARITIVTEESLRSPVRPLPANCDVISVLAEDAAPVRTHLRAALGHLRSEWKDGPRGIGSRIYMLRSLAFYLRRASTIVHTVRQHLSELTNPPATCFYSYWLDYKAFAAAELSRSVPGSIAVSRVHGYDLYAERHPHGYLPLRREMAERLAAIFAVSDAGAGHLKGPLGGAGNVLTSRLGVPALRSGAPPFGLPECRCQVVVSIGSLIPVKRVGLLLEALRALGFSNGLSWRHFGDGPLMEELGEKARALRIPHLFGHLPNAQLRSSLLRDAHHAVLVNVSASEGLPVSMMEAMACGIPCIGTDVGGVTEIIHDGVNGYLLPADPSAAQIRNVIEVYLGLAASKRLEMRRAAFDTWATRYEAHQNYSDFAQRLAALMPR